MVCGSLKKAVDSCSVSAGVSKNVSSGFVSAEVTTISSSVCDSVAFISVDTGTDSDGLSAALLSSSLLFLP
jgi:hypothetical protein